MEAFDVKTLDEVDAWVARNGVEALNELMEPGRIDFQRRALVAAWSERRARAAEAEREAKASDLLRRSTEAAEKSAAAAVDSAAHAGDSARWSKWAVVIAAVALIVSAWPYVKDVVRWVITGHSPAS